MENKQIIIAVVTVLGILFLNKIKPKLKNKWHITSEFQYWVIMVVFSLAGSSVVYIKRPVFAYAGIGPETPFLLKFLMWLVVVFPGYQVLLMFWGTVLGQFRFVWWFEKKMLRRMRLYPPDDPDNPDKP